QTKRWTACALWRTQSVDGASWASRETFLVLDEAGRIVRRIEGRDRQHLTYNITNRGLELQPDLLAAEAQDAATLRLPLGAYHVNALVIFDPAKTDQLKPGFGPQSLGSDKAVAVDLKIDSDQVAIPLSESILEQVRAALAKAAK